MKKIKETKLAYLEKSEIIAVYDSARSNARQFFGKYPEFERLASNQLMDKMPKNMPKVNDGSLAALLRETPKRMLAEVPIGHVSVHDREEPWLIELANIVWLDEIIPNANSQAPFYTKLLIGFYNALKYGGQPVFTFLKAKGEYKCADFILPYVKDVYLEPGKTSDLDSDYIFLTTHYTKLQIKQIIKAAEQEAKDAKEQKREPEGGWDVAELKKVLDRFAAGKDSDHQNAQERGQSKYAEVYKFVTCFQRGYGSPFHTFFEDSDLKESNIVRTVYNDDPTGNIPITYIYGDQDLVNPYGVSQIETSGGTQNVLDYLTQLHVLATQLGLQPPVRIAGDRSSTNLSSLVYAPRQFWFTGNAQVEPVTMSNSIHANFPSAYGLYKTQLQNLQGTTDAAVSSESGQPAYSKTPAGVKFQAQRQSATDSFWRRQIFTAFEKIAANLLNIHFNSMHGTDILKLTEENAQKLMLAGLIDEDPDTPGVPSTDEIAMDWEKLRGQFSFRVDADASLERDQEEERNKMLEVIKLAATSPNLLAALQQGGRTLDLAEVLKRYFINLRVKDPEKLIPEVQRQQGGGQELQQIMQHFGVDEKTAAVIGQALQEGIPEDAITNWLKGQQGQPQGQPQGEIIGTPGQ